MKKKIIATFLLVAMVVSGVTVSPTMVEASEEGYKDEIIFEDRTSEFNTMWKADGKGDSPIKEGYVFGGWYMENTDGQKQPLNVNDAKDKKDDDLSEGIYAKFVPVYVLSVKVQHQSGIAEGHTAPASVRVISSIDSTNYAKVGFDVLVNNKNKLYHCTDGDDQFDDELETTKVYKGLIVGTDTNNPRYPQTIFGRESEYLSVWKLSGVAKEYDAMILKITPYWITMDGTKVSGLSKFVHVEDGYKGYVNIPINLTTGEEVAAGQLQMKYDPTILKLAESSDGVVYDKAVEFDGVFKASEMAYHDDGEGTITFVGNADEVNTHKIADDIFANVRFQIVDKTKYPDTTSEDFLTFQVDGENFCNWGEDDVKVNAWDIQH